MKTRSFALAAVPVALGAAAYATRSRLGALTYAGTMAIEARIAGFHTREVDVDGLAMSLYEGGRTEAPTVVLIHGFSADRGVWIRFAKHLMRDFHVVIPDLAGHGTTPYVAGAGFSGSDQAARVAGLIDHLGTGPVHVAGNSMGGFVAATLAVEHPEHVQSLALIDAAGVASPIASEAQGMIDQGANPFLMDDPAAFPAFYALTMAKPPFVPGFVRAAMATDYVERRDRLAEIFDDFFEVGYLDHRLGEIKTPTLVMWGREDRLLHVSMAGVWAAIDRAQQIIYDGVGHMPMVEVPKQSAADYQAFLRGLNS